MKTSDGSFQYCYNAQVIAEERSQVVLAYRVGQSGADCPTLPGMLTELDASLTARCRRWTVPVREAPGRDQRVDPGRERRVDVPGGEVPGVGQQGPGPGGDPRRGAGPRPGSTRNS